MARLRLDREMQIYRKAAREKNATRGLLHAVRQALGIPVTEIAREMGVCRSGVFNLEKRELTGAIELRSLERQARAMGCKVVYGIVPLEEKTLEEVAELRMWRKELEKRGARSREQGTGNRGQGTGDRPGRRMRDDG